MLQDKLAIFGRPANSLTKNGEGTVYQVRGKDRSFYKGLSTGPEEKIIMNYPKKVIGPNGPVRYPPF
ncbi:hypothetical protein [Terriglobus sp.]|uniref:hypothetical protein n=1 Tax=Terriglobus sp. TaxID=1889013 RepID=UPI003B006164